MEEAIKRVKKTFDHIQEAHDQIHATLIVIEDFCCLDDDRTIIETLHQQSRSVGRALRYSETQLKGIRTLSLQETSMLIDGLSDLLLDCASSLKLIAKEVWQIAERFRSKQMKT